MNHLLRVNNTMLTVKLWCELAWIFMPKGGALLKTLACLVFAGGFRQGKQEGSARVGMTDWTQGKQQVFSHGQPGARFVTESKKKTNKKKKSRTFTAFLGGR